MANPAELGTLPGRNFTALRQRLNYVSNHLFGGNVHAFAAKLGMRFAYLDDTLRGNHTPHIKLLTRLAQAGVVNAEWLLCGTGPVCPGGTLVPVPSSTCADVVKSEHPHFDTTIVQYEIPQHIPPPAALAARKPSADELQLARAIHAARSHDKPVVLFLGAEAVLDHGGPVVARMLEKNYVTGLALSSGAACVDVELASFGGKASTEGRLQELQELNRAALLAAPLGVGYGEALGRWSYPVTSHRADSPLAVAYSLGLPVTVHLALGDAPNHIYPAIRGTELGAALGAASYVDLLVFAEQLKKFGGNPGGVFINAEPGTQADFLFRNALAAVQSDAVLKIENYECFQIRGDYRVTLSALLTACDSVYDGSADNGR